MPVHRIDHPLVADALHRMRNPATATADFRRLAVRITTCLVYEALRDLNHREKTAAGGTGETPVERKVNLVPILRAGLAMLPGALDVIAGASIGLLGIHRQPETLEPEVYLTSLPPCTDSTVTLVLDPILATGGTLSAGIDRIKAAGCQQVVSVHLVAAPEGVDRIGAAHPEVPIYLASVDQGLDHRGLIIPGIGDAGDRYTGVPWTC